MAAGTTITATATAASPPSPPQGPQGVGSTVDIFGFHLDWMVVALILVLAVAAYALYKAQLNQQNQIDLLDLLSEDGKLSRSACVMMGAFGVTTWMLIQLTLNGKMTEGFFGLYSAAWIAPTVTRMFAPGHGVVEPPKQG